MIKLTLKQQAFCDYYIETGNATEAAVRAGYSKKTAKVIGQENLTKPYLRRYIDERLQQKESQRIASQDEILQFLTSVVRGEVTEQVPIVMRTSFELPDKTPSVHDRVKAAELLGKRYMLWTEKQIVDGTQEIVFIDNVGDDD